MQRILLIAILGLMTSFAHAVDAVGQRYIDKLTRGGMVSIKQAAQGMYNTGESNPEVVDVAAEVLLQRYANAGNSEIDTLAWLSKAIGNSRNGRYHSTLQEVVKSKANKKLRKHAKNALKQLGKAKGPQYARGSVDLAALRAGNKKAKSNKAKARSAPQSSGKEGIEVIRECMSMQEVYDLIGQPTATTSRQTGKAWIPFNYGAKDLARTYLLYKGQGRVVCSHSGYSSTSRVIEVIIDPEESGYP